jgi:hypothetical protein
VKVQSRQSAAFLPWNHSGARWPRCAGWLYLLALALVLLALAWPAASAAAQGSSPYAARFEVTIHIERAGSFLVTETQEIVFPATRWFSTGFREIPLERLERITDVRLEEPGQLYRHAGGPSDVAASAGDQQPVPAVPAVPRTFVTSVQDGRLRIDWWFPETRGQARTFSLSYRVYGGLRVYSAGDQLFWKAIYSNRPYPIEAASVRVEFPGPVPQTELKWAVYPARQRVQVEQPDRATLLVRTLHGLAANEGLEVRVQFPHGLVQAQPPAWQAQADREDAYNQHIRPLLNFGLGLLALVTSLVGGLGVFLAWYTRGRDPEVGRVPDELEEPPSDLLPGVVGTLIDQKADVQDVVATMLDLARRGVVRIAEEAPRPGRRRDYRLSLTPQAESALLHPLERAVLEAVFAGQQTVLLSEVRRRFASRIPELERRFYDEAVAQGLLERDPAPVRRGYARTGALLLGAGLVGALLSLLFFGRAAELAFLPFLALAGVGGLLLGVADHMPRRTRTGALEAARWAAFRRYLRDMDRGPELRSALPLEERRARFERFLPYAVALGVDRTWMQKLAIAGAPAPRWYDMEVPSPAGPLPRRLGPRGWPAPGGWVGMPYPVERTFGQPAAPRPGGSEQAGSPLDETSERGARGLEEMSRRLAELLNEASDALAGSGAPGSGWSGGGRGGRGGGGGGSGGFR